jgi:hypothetical protein
LQDAAEVEIVLFDMTGKMVMKGFNGTMNAGANNVQLNVQDLTAGMYNAVISSKSTVKNVRLVITK